MRDLDWMADARCAQVDPDLWHPETGSSSYCYARQICHRCPVQHQCAAFAARIEDDADKKDRHGLWAGKTRNERATHSGKGRVAVHEEIVRLANQGVMDAQQIADTVGVDVRTVFRVTKNHRDRTVSQRSDREAVAR